MRLENEYVHYRASFVVTPTAGTPDSAFPYIAERLQQWVELKEEEHTAGGSERSVIARVLHSNAIDLSDTYDISMAGDDVGVTSVPCYVSEAFISGFSLPKEYEGGLSTRSDARMICTRTPWEARSPR